MRTGEQTDVLRYSTNCKNTKSKVKIKIIGYFFANWQKMNDIFDLSPTFS